MRTFLTLIEIIAALGVIGTILIHAPKGEGMGSIGGQAKLFGAQKGLDSGLDRLTMGLAATFLVCALILAALK